MNFKGIFRFIASVLTCAAFSFSAQADYGSGGSAAPDRSYDKKPIQAQLMVSTVGTGAHVGYHINDMFFIGADFSTISLSDEQTEDENKVDIDLNFSSQVLLVRMSPFSGSFFVQGGLVHRSWEVEGDGVSKIGNTNVQGRVKATVKFPSVAANLGIGWNWISDPGFSGGLGLGVITGGKPSADLDASPLMNLAGVSQEDIKKEEENLESEMGKYATFPYIHVNIGWNF